MKKTLLLMLLCMGIIIYLPSYANQSEEHINEIGIEELPAVETFLSEQDTKLLTQNPETDFVYIPAALKTTVKLLKINYTDLAELIDLSLFLDENVHVAPTKAVENISLQLLNLLTAADVKKNHPEDNSLHIIEHYLGILQNGNAHITLGELKELEEEQTTQVRGRRCKKFCNLWVIDNLTTGSLNVSCNATICGNLTVAGTINGQSGSAGSNQSFVTDAGTAIPVAGVLDIVGGSNINTSGSGQTVTINLDNNVVIPGSLAVDGSITAGNGLTVSAGAIKFPFTAGALTSTSTGILASAPGTNGQVLIGSTGNPPVFNALTSTNNSIIFTPGAGTLNLQSVPVFGNIARVDAVYGNDATGALNGAPFATIAAAMAVAVSGTTIWIFPGTYNEAVVIKNAVSVAGITSGGYNSSGVRIQQTNVTANTDLVTMGESSRLSNVTLNLTSNAGSNVQLRGIVFLDTTSQTSTVSMVNLNVTNTGNAGGNTYGIHSIGTGNAGTNLFALQDSTVTVSTSGTQVARGVIVDTAVNTFNIRTSSITVTNSGGGSAIGVQTNLAGASCIISSSTVSGNPTADIAQSAGTLIVSNSNLVNSNANSFGFTSTGPASTITWATNTTPAVGTAYMTPGTAATQATLVTSIPYVATQPCIIKNMYAQSATAAGAAGTTFTLLKNGIATGLTVSLASGNNSANSTASNVSVSCVAGNTLTLQIVTGTVGASDIAVTAEVY